MTGDLLFSGTFARGRAAAAVSDAAWLRAMLDAEAALALAQADLGLLDAGIGRQISAACRDAAFDAADIGRRAAAGGNPIIPLVDSLRQAVGGDTAQHVHWGATSQDILDTATMLVVHRALEPLLDDLGAAADAAAALAGAHRATPMLGRTLMQAALPITFGWEAAGWTAALDAGAASVAGLRRGALAVQLGGPVGTLADFGERAPELVVAYAKRLGLAVPPMTGHAQRTRPLQVAAALGIAAGACAKVGRDVTLLAQPEVGEVEERIPGSGGSSSMAHKHNPIGAISATACAERVPGLVATLFASAEQEHQRAAGRWHAEWPGPIVALAGSAAAWIRDSLTHLAVHPERMAVNLELAATDPATTDRYLAAAAAAVDRAIGARKGSDLP